MAAMRVARVLGWFNVDAMLASGNRGQLDEWIEFERLEPFGWEQPSMIAANIINAMRSLVLADKMKDEDFIAPDAFVPKPRVAAKSGHVSPERWVAGFRLSAGV